MTVTDSAAARLLLRPDERRYLEPFIGRERSTAEAAREIGVTTEQMSYRVKALSGRGLLGATGRIARKGRPITLYRAPREFRAPLRVLPEADVLHLFDLIDAGTRNVFLTALSRLATGSGMLDWVVRCYRGPSGAIHLDMTPADAEWSPAALLDEKAPAVVFNWVPVALDAAQAKELQAELLRIVSRLRPSTTAPTHLVGMFLTPL
ncbi:hypothetical protein Aph01nite_54490 [Acrocarpospora phusangensis]|uniref:Uncharacterized protein n=2 Tax=Acrocarpospora phusangensis TaxID=1070424 RepID=A0A919UMP6_9ACTN|nr:hypothetical protein Aph01nite_54490 [Acrocarpospora phusangensis]